MGLESILGIVKLVQYISKHQNKQQYIAKNNRGCLGGQSGLLETPCFLMFLMKLRTVSILSQDLKLLVKAFDTQTHFAQLRFLFFIVFFSFILKVCSKCQPNTVTLHPHLRLKYWVHWDNSLRVAPLALVEGTHKGRCALRSTCK